MSGFGGIITGGLGVNNQSQEAASADIFLAPFSLYLNVDDIIITPTPTTPDPTPTPVPEDTVSIRAGGAARPYDEEDNLLQVKFSVEIKGKTKSQTINIDVNRIKGHVDIMRRLKDFSWTPKITKRLK